MIEINLHDIESSVELMDKYGNTEFPFFGENEAGDTTVTSVFPNRIVMITYQPDNWYRLTVLYRDGTITDEYNQE